MQEQNNDLPEEQIIAPHKVENGEISDMKDILQLQKKYFTDCIKHENESVMQNYSDIMCSSSI